jgi:hypothetical protein
MNCNSKIPPRQENPARCTRFRKTYEHSEEIEVELSREMS